MELVTLHELLTDARRNKYAVGGFNVFNVEGVKNILETAEELAAPVILQAATQEIEYSSGECFISMIKSLGSNKKVRIAIHLDHGSDFAYAVKCIRYGFTSVMFDGSHLPFEENINQTKKITEVAKAAGISIEAELGTIGNTDENGERIENPYMTDPEAVKDFVKRTGVDCLAVSFGTVHGLYKHELSLDLERLERISKKVKIPLVMHGGSGVPEKLVKESIKLGICKINISSILQKKFADGLRTFLMNNTELPWGINLFNAASETTRDAIKKHMIMLGSSSRI